MYFFSLVAPLACLSAVANAALTTVEYDLVFPRDNVSYAPTPYLPMVFAVKNYNPAFDPFIFLGSEYPNGTASRISLFASGRVWGNPAKNDAAFVYALFNVIEAGFKQDGTQPLDFWIGWTSCSDGPNAHGGSDSDTKFKESSRASIRFRADKGGQAVNLLSTKDTKCPARPGIRIALDDTAKPVVDPSTGSSGFHWCITIMDVETEGSDVVSDACTVDLPTELVDEIASKLSLAACDDDPSCRATATAFQPSKTATAAAGATHTGSTTQPAAATTTTSGPAKASDPAKNAGDRLTMARRAGLAVWLGMFGLLLA